MKKSLNHANNLANNFASPALNGNQISLKRHQVLELLILAGLAVLLLLYLLFRSAGNFSYKLPQFEEVPKSEIQNIHWSRNDGSEYILRKNGDTWYIGEEKYPAKQSYVDTLIEQLSQPSLQDLVSQSGSLVTFGLNDERAYKLEAFSADGKEPLRQFFVGKSSSSGRYSYVRMGAEQQKVYTLSANLSSILEKSVDDLRDRLVVSFSSGNIEKLQIRRVGEAGEADETAKADKTDSVSVEKKDGKWQIPEDVTWGEDQVNRLVNRFASMNAQSFIQSYPETDSEYEIQFIAKGGVSYTVTVAAEPLDGQSNKGYAAKSSSYGFPFTLNNYTVESMLKDFGFIEEEELQDGGSPS